MVMVSYARGHTCTKDYMKFIQFNFLLLLKKNCVFALYICLFVCFFVCLLTYLSINQLVFFTSNSSIIYFFLHQLTHDKSVDEATLLKRKKALHIVGDVCQNNYINTQIHMFSYIPTYFLLSLYYPFAKFHSRKKNFN